MHIPSPVNYLCAVTELSILIVTSLKDMCRYPPFSSFWTHLWSLLRPCRLAQTLSGPPAAWRKYIFFKVHVSPLYLFHLQSLVYYLQQSQRTLSLMNSTSRLRKNHLHKIFDPPPQKMYYLVLCFWGQVVIWELWEYVRQLMKTLFQKMNLLRSSSIYFFLCMLSHAL